MLHMSYKLTSPGHIGAHCPCHKSKRNESMKMDLKAFYWKSRLFGILDPSPSFTITHIVELMSYFLNLETAHFLSCQCNVDP